MRCNGIMRVVIPFLQQRTNERCIPPGTRARPCVCCRLANKPTVSSYHTFEQPQRTNGQYSIRRVGGSRLFYFVPSSFQGHREATYDRIWQIRAADCRGADHVTQRDVAMNLIFDDFMISNVTLLLAGCRLWSLVDDDVHFKHVHHRSQISLHLSRCHIWCS